MNNELNLTVDENNQDFSVLTRGSNFELISSGNLVDYEELKGQLDYMLRCRNNFRNAISLTAQLHSF